jgi:hypothetical protein
MPNKTIKVNGKEIEVIEMEPIEVKENWSEYKLDDGKIVAVKVALISIYKAINEKDPEGNPLYSVKNQLIIKVK